MTNENQFLNLLAKDIDDWSPSSDENPNQLKTIISDLVIHVKHLTEDVEVNLDDMLLEDET